MEKNFANIFYTYIYRDPSRNNEPIYVGKGTGRRARVHLGRKDKSPFTSRLIHMRRANVTPYIEIIVAMDEDHAKFMEICCISVIGRKDLGKGPLLNLTDGGEGTSGGIRSAEYRAKISKSLTGVVRSDESKKRNSESHKGTRHSLESRKNRSRRQKGRPGKPVTEDVKIKLRMINEGKKIILCSCLRCHLELGVTNLSRHFGKGNCKVFN